MKIDMETLKEKLDAKDDEKTKMKNEFKKVVSELKDTNKEL